MSIAARLALLERSRGRVAALVSDLDAGRRSLRDLSDGELDALAGRCPAVFDRLLDGMSNADLERIVAGDLGPLRTVLDAGCDLTSLGVCWR